MDELSRWDTVKELVDEELVDEVLVGQGVVDVGVVDEELVDEELVEWIRSRDLGLLKCEIYLRTA